VVVAVAVVVVEWIQVKETQPNDNLHAPCEPLRRCPDRTVDMNRNEKEKEKEKREQLRPSPSAPPLHHAFEAPVAHPPSPSAPIANPR